MRVRASHGSHKRSQGGVQVPTGGDSGVSHEMWRLTARERPRLQQCVCRQAGGQQIRCDSEADGDSPDGRERALRSHIFVAAWYPRTP